MNKRNRVLFFFLVSASIYISAQQPASRKLFLGYYLSSEVESKKFSLGFDVGRKAAYEPQLNSNKWLIRDNIGSAYPDYGFVTSNSLMPGMTVSYFSVKPEYLFLNDLLNLSSGLRLSYGNSYIRKGMADDNDNFFYLLYKQSGNITEYAKVREITQNSYYLGIPFELSVIPVKYELISFYAKVGTELNFKLNSKTNIQFLNNTMEPYQQEILDETGVETNSTLTTFYSSIGCRVGKVNHVKYNFEINLPSYILSKNNSSLVNPGSLGGFMFSVEVPFK